MGAGRALSPAKGEVYKNRSQSPSQSLDGLYFGTDTGVSALGQRGQNVRGPRRVEALLKTTLVLPGQQHTDNPTKTDRH